MKFSILKISLHPPFTKGENIVMLLCELKNHVDSHEKGNPWFGRLTMTDLF